MSPSSHQRGTHPAGRNRRRRTDGLLTAVETETPVSDLFASTSSFSFATSTLDRRDLMLARVAALIAVDAPPLSYLTNIAGELDLNVDEVRGILTAVAPIVGSALVASATKNIADALGSSNDLADLESALGIRRLTPR